jgi:pimeloyl-ACP methyl ester carboxylesterase
MPKVDSAGVQIAYEVHGDGPPIVLVHGFMSSFEGNWQQPAIAALLEDDGRQVIGMDCRGHGRSDKPHDPVAYAGNAMPDDVIAVMDDLKLDRADIMGYSMGGWITANVVSRHASRFNAVIVGGAGLRNRASDPALRAVLAAAYEAQDPSSITDPLARSFRQFAEQNHNDLAAMAAIQRSMRGESDEAALRALKLALIAIVGDQDPALEAARALVDVVPGARLEILPGADHLSAVPDARYKRAVTEFLSTASPTNGSAITTH